jgi:cytochrome b involved in lipid metabolism
MHRASALVEIIPKEDITSTSRIAQKNAVKLRGAARNGRTLREISIEELEAANSVEKPWVAVRGKVYDLTKFVDKHPGGRDFLLLSVGRDATSLYESLHSEKMTKVLKYVHIFFFVGISIPVTMTTANNWAASTTLAILSRQTSPNTMSRASFTEW